MKTLILFLLMVSRVGLGISCYEDVAVWAKGTSANYFYRPYWLDPESIERPDIKVLSSTQSYVEDWVKVAALKKAMLNGSFAFSSLEGRIGGEYHEPRKIFFVGEGHHRLAAALEIAFESGNWSCFNKLIRYGDWEKTSRNPRDAYRLPVRSRMLTYLGWGRFLKPFTP